MSAGNGVLKPPSALRASRSPSRAVDGILLLDKPIGVTSNQALQRVKRLFLARKGGHTGSLDPLATGMLPICLGEATKISAFLLDSDKVYRVRLALGSQTATGDAEGSVIDKGPDSVSEAGLQEAIRHLQGAISQIPPMYSALKYQGRRLYELARAGQEVVREPRIVKIHELAIESYDPGRPVLRVRCSKGTYIRSLAEDIAREAGTVGHVAELRRLSVDPFPEEAMITMEAIEAAAGRGMGAVDALLVPADQAVPHWPAVRLTAPQSLRIRQGQAVPAVNAGGPPAGMVRLYDEGGQFLGIGECLADDRILPRRLLADALDGA